MIGERSKPTRVDTKNVPEYEQSIFVEKEKKEFNRQQKVYRVNKVSILDASPSKCTV